MPYRLIIKYFLSLGSGYLNRQPAAFLISSNCQYSADGSAIIIEGQNYQIIYR